MALRIHTQLSFNTTKCSPADWLRNQRLILTCWQMTLNLKQPCSQASAISWQNCQCWGGTVHFASKCNKEINPVGRDLRGHGNEDKSCRRQLLRQGCKQVWTMVWVQEAFASIFKYWSPENHLTQSLLKFSTCKFPDIISPTDQAWCKILFFWTTLLQFHTVTVLSSPCPWPRRKNLILLQCAQDSLFSSSEQWKRHLTSRMRSHPPYFKVSFKYHWFKWNLHSAEKHQELSAAKPEPPCEEFIPFSLWPRKHALLSDGEPN